MREKIKFHAKYIIGVGAEKLRLIGDIIILVRGFTGTIMGHPLSIWERGCYLAAGILGMLSFIVPITLHGNQLVDIFQHFEWSMSFWRSFGKEIIYVSIWYTIFTTAGRVTYLMSKPTQIKKVISHWKKRKS